MILQEKFTGFAGILLILICCAADRASAQSTVTKCFQNEALKGMQIVNLKVSGELFTGTFEYENGESELAQKYKFSGRIAGSVLRLKFENGVLPDVAPSEMRNLNWKIIKKTSGEILQIEFYGKNYETGKRSDYAADFYPCEPTYLKTANSAKRIAFARGEKSVKFSLLFAGNQSENKSYLLGARKNQTISVRSIGCAISFYYPDKKLYEEVSAIDVLTLVNISQTGDYLFFIRPAGTTGKCPTEFKITG